MSERKATFKDLVRIPSSETQLVPLPGQEESRSDSGDTTPVRDGSELEQIRSLLFGDQQRHQSSRVETIEEQARGNGELLATLSETVAELQSTLGELKKVLDDGVSEQLEEHEQKTSDLTARFDSFNASLDERLDGLEGRLRSDLDAQRTSLTSLVQERHGEVLQLVDDDLAKLKAADTDRAAVADLLHDLARRFGPSES